MRGVQKCPCGQVVVFVRDEAGKWQVLDVASGHYIYKILWTEAGATAVRQEHQLPSRPGGTEPVLVSHFRTCKQVERFAKSLKQLEQEGVDRVQAPPDA